MKVRFHLPILNLLARFGFSMHFFVYVLWYVFASRKIAGRTLDTDISSAHYFILINVKKT